MTLKELKSGQWAVVDKVGGEGVLRQHFLDMGVLPGAEVQMVKLAPMGDPMELMIRGYSLTMRLADAAKIQVSLIPAPSAHEEKPVLQPLPSNNFVHPGIGETGRYHSKDHENPLPKDTKLTFALAGNQNCGKTTLFNQLTGANQHVGNFPGVTVDRKDGIIRGIPDSLVTDLPGIYSLSPYTTEEIVTRKFILDQKPKGIINIVDASNIERNLYLTMQLMELDIPVVLALNMMDEVRSNGGTIRVNRMESLLGIPVIPISAANNEGIDELIEHAVHIAQYQETPARKDFCDKNAYGGAVHRCLHGIMHLIEDHAEKAGIPVRFAAGKLVEGDAEIQAALGLDQNETEMIEHIILQMEQERGLDRSAAIADMRFTFIRELCDATVVKPRKSREYIRSQRADRILTGRFTAIPIFIFIMTMVIWLSIDVLGAPLQEWLDQGIQWLAGVCDSAMIDLQVNQAVRSLVVDGIFGGVGSVVSFVPVIIILFFFLSMLEDSGYMARVAFVTDKLLRKIGLSGRSIVPMLIGFGCSVPAVMATRTLPSVRDRRKTIMLTPFMSCSAKIPIYGFLTSAFFPGYGGLVLVLLYLSGILMGIVTALIEKALKSRGEAAPFVMELPNYRMPGARNVIMLLWDKTRDFLQRAFTIIFIASVIIWFLQSFDFHFTLVEDSRESILASVAGLVAPLFKPIGLGQWQIVTALVSGFLAKESVVSTLQVLDVNSVLNTLTAIPMLVFCLLYTPCVAAIASIKRELGSKWAFFIVLFQCAIAWLCAFGAYLVAGIFL